MKVILKLVTISIAVSLALYPLMVFASTTAVVVVTANPMYSAGITSFTITYVSDTQMDLAWTVDATVDKVMVRGKYGSYPADIPNDHTAPSDGYLVYYGFEFTDSDTSMNFDQNPGILYYKAWAQKPDMTWYVNTSIGKKESKTMALLFLLGFGALVSYFAIKNRNFMIAAIASALWILLLSYTRSNPISGTVTGDTADTLLVVVCIALTVAVPLISWQFSRQDRREEVEENNDTEETRQRKSQRDYGEVVGANKHVNLLAMSDQDYANILRGRRNRR
jgi:hypothetical protein